MTDVIRLPYTGGMALAAWDGNVTGGMAAGAGRNVFITQARPTNDQNLVILDVANASTDPTIATRGKRGALVTFDTCIKPYNSAGPVGWSDAAIFKSFINVGTTVASSEFTERFSFQFSEKDNLGGTYFRQWDWGRCSRIRLRGRGSSGVVAVSLTFPCLTGDSQVYTASGPVGTNNLYQEMYYALNGLTNLTAACPYIVTNLGTPPTFTNYATDAGDLSYVSGFDFKGGTTGGGPNTANTLTLVEEWMLTINRRQKPMFAQDGSIFYYDLASGMRSGSFVVTQTSGAYIMPVDGTPILIGISTNQTQTTGRHCWTIYPRIDSINRAVDTDTGKAVSSMQLMDESAGPCVTVDPY